MVDDTVVDGPGDSVGGLTTGDKVHKNERRLGKKYVFSLTRKFSRLG